MAPEAESRRSPPYSLIALVLMAVAIALAAIIACEAPIGPPLTIRERAWVVLVLGGLLFAFVALSVFLDRRGREICHLGHELEECRRHKREIEEERREERQRCAAWFAQAPAAVALLRGPEHIVEQASLLYLELAGNPWLEGKPACEAPLGPADAMRALMDRAYAHGLPVEGECFEVDVDRRCNGNLEEAWYQLVCQPLHGTGGAVDRVLLVARNVTRLVHERHECEAAEAELARLRERRKELGRQLGRCQRRRRWLEEMLRAWRHARRVERAMLDGVSILVVVLDRAGSVVRLNEACEKWTGYSSEAAIGHPYWELFLAPDERDGARACLEALVDQGGASEHEEHWLGADGSRRTISWTWKVLPGTQGTAEYVIGAGREVVEQRETERPGSPPPGARARPHRRATH